MYHPHTWVEINFDAMAKNICEIKKSLSANQQIIAVVKADAYGFGAVEVARFLVSQGVSALAVSVLSEGIELRRAGISTPILVFNYIPEKNCDLVMHYNLIPTVYSCKFAKVLNATARNWGRKLDVHVNIDTGMSRLGVIKENSNNIITCLKECNYLNVAGIYSHFAAADNNNTEYTISQYNAFKKIVTQFQQAGFEKAELHMANSAAVLRGIGTDCNYVRVGAALYGFKPDEHMENYLHVNRLAPVMAMKTVIAHLKTLPAGIPISYGCTYTTKHKTKVATLPVGYADGYKRILSNRAYVLVNGKRAPIIGTVCMDQCMVDVTHIDTVAVGDEVILFGKQGNEEISLAQIAKWCETINYEVPCLINRRVPRYYFKNNNLLVNRGHIDNL